MGRRRAGGRRRRAAPGCGGDTARDGRTVPRAHGGGSRVQDGRRGTRGAAPVGGAKVPGPREGRKTASFVRWPAFRVSVWHDLCRASTVPGCKARAKGPGSRLARPLPRFSSPLHASFMPNPVARPLPSGRGQACKIRAKGPRRSAQQARQTTHGEGRTTGAAGRETRAADPPPGMPVVGPSSGIVKRGPGCDTRVPVPLARV